MHGTASFSHVTWATLQNFSVSRLAISVLLCIMHMCAFKPERQTVAMWKSSVKLGAVYSNEAKLDSENRVRSI